MLYRAYSIIFLLLNLAMNKYTFIQDVTNLIVESGWQESISETEVPQCTNDNKEIYIGYQEITPIINWKKTYAISKSTKTYFYFEFQISGNWNEDEIQVIVNGVKIYSLVLSLVDIHRSCNSQFLFDAYAYFIVSHIIDEIQLEIKISANNAIGLYIKNVIIVTQSQSGRDEQFNYIESIQSCSSGAIYNQYYCICGNNLVYQTNQCIEQCSANYLYNQSDNTCYYKAHCSKCVGFNTKLKCDDGYFSINEHDITISQCLQKCPFTHFLDDNGKSCIEYVAYYTQKMNGGYPVNQFSFYNSLPDFLHYLKSDDIQITIYSIPEKQSFRKFFYNNGKFFIGTDDMFQSQQILISQKIETSQHRLNVKAVVHFVDFYPSQNNFIINGIRQNNIQIIQDNNDLQQQGIIDYIAYYDFWWMRTEQYPPTENLFLFEVEQSQQNGEFKGRFYIEDFQIFSFECETDCAGCFRYQQCFPCLYPENKNPSDCQCLSGYVRAKKKCIVCPTYCVTCSQPNECNECQPNSLRLNPPSCNSCPDGYYAKDNTDICQFCSQGCKVCSNVSTCQNCFNGYYRDIQNICVLVCPDGYFSDSTSSIDPICSKCDDNCFKCENKAKKCVECNGISTLFQNHCYTCSQGYYLSGIDCFPCIANCESCSSEQCNLCIEQFFYHSQINECLPQCDEGFFENQVTRVCDPCYINCKTCSSGTERDCLTCVSGKVLNLLTIYNGECLNNCWVGFYRINDECLKCWKGCQSCIDQSFACLVCAQNFYRLKSDNNCYEICPNGYYNNPIGNLCSQCNTNCKTCKGYSENSCLSCNPPLGLYKNQCLSNCYEGYGNFNNICTACSQNCKSCFGVMPNQCLSCIKGYFFLNNQCYGKCPTHFIGIRPQYVCKCIYENCVACQQDQYFLPNQCYTTCPSGHYGYNGLCISCEQTCNACFGESFDQCLNCNSGLILFQNTCIPECLGNTYHEISINECKQCDKSCLGCNGPNDDQCTVCYDDKLLTKQGKCKSYCPDGQYPVIGENRCYNCHPSCQTCFGQSSKNCLTCKNFFYLYECVSFCPDGFKISQTGFSCEPNFLIVVNQCSYQCEDCLLTKRFCTKCSANRASNPPICSCESGYFDDGINSKCLKCANKCLTCTQSASNCLSCKGDRLLPHCNCPSFYFDDGLQVNCIKCQDNCLTCNQVGCTQCLGDRIDLPKCVCQDGYYDAFMQYCQECQKQCLTCSETAMLCTTCQGIRKNIPICQCPEGYFENSDEDCQQCDPTCEDCNQFGCLSCIGNRIGPSQGECNCDYLGISRYNIGSVYCTDCMIGVPYFGLNQDFTGFYFEFGGQAFISEDIKNNYCEAFFPVYILEKLGENPICDEDFNVKFGTNPNIEVEDIIQLNPTFYLSGCNHNFIKVLEMPLMIPAGINLETHKPLIKFNDFSKTQVCNELRIQFEETYFTGGQKLKILAWKQLKPEITTQEIQQVLDSGKDEYFLNFPTQIFELGKVYQIAVYFESFAKLQNSASITFEAVQYSVINFYPTSKTNQFLRYEKISIPIQILYSNCIEKSPPKQTLFYEILLKGKNIQLSKGSINENLVDGFTFEFPLEFKEYYFNFDNPHILQFNSRLERFDYKISFTSYFDLYIIPSIPILTILEGNRMVGYTENLYLNASIQDRDLTSEENAQQLNSCQWNCRDIINGTECFNKSQQQIIFNNNCNQYFPAKSFNPYSVMIFQSTIIKEGILYSTNVSIQITELDLPKLSMSGTNSSVIYNYYDEFIYHLSYPGINPDLLLYAGAIIYDNVVYSTFQFYFLEFKFKLQNYFTHLVQEKGNQVKIRFSIYDPRYVMPSLNTIVLSMNIPPQECTLEIRNPQFIIEFLDKLDIEIVGCKDSDLPLLYSLYLFPNESIYNSDLMSSNFYNYLLLSPLQLENNFSIRLPYFSEQKQLLFINIQDSLEGKSNLTYLISVKKYLNSEQSKTPNIVTQVFQQFELDFKSQDETLIGYNLITKRISNLNCCTLYKQELFLRFLKIDQTQELQINQTEILYRAINNLLEQNNTLIGIYDEKLITLLSKRIGIAKTILQEIFNLQYLQPISSSDNTEKLNYFQFYQTAINIISSGINYKTSRNESSTNYLEQLYIIQGSLQNISVANEPLFSSLSSSFNLNLGFLTQKIAEQMTSCESNFQSSTSTKFYRYSMTRYINNPFYTDEKFPKNSSGYQAIDPQIKQSGEGQSQLIGSNIKYKFPNKKQLTSNLTLKCISKVASGEWNVEVCKTKQINNETICECTEVNPTSIMETLNFIEDKVIQVFSSDTLFAFGTFPIYETFIFYFYILITGAYLYIVYWGIKVDNQMFIQIQSLKEQQNQNKIQEPEIDLGDIDSKSNQNNIIDNILDQMPSKKTISEYPKSQKIHSILSLKDIKDDEVAIQQLPDLGKFNFFSNLGSQEQTAYMLQPGKKNWPTEQLNSVGERTKSNEGQNDMLLTEKQSQTQHHQDNFQNLENEQNKNNNENKSKNLKKRSTKGLKTLVISNSITQIKAYLEYLKFFHQILSIIYKSDETKPRSLRASIVYTSILGSLAVLFLFNQPSDINLTISLALLTSPLNKIYQLILEKLLSHNNKKVRQFGAVIMLVCAAIISYIMLSGLVLLDSIEKANDWSYIFIGTFVTDNIIYSPIQLCFQYLVHLDILKFRVIQKILEQLLDEKAKEFLYGLIDKIQVQQT